MATSTPFGVGLVAVIAWITGVIQLISGVFSMIGGNLVVGITTAVIGVITIAVSLGLFRGSRTARTIMTVVFLLNIAASVYIMITTPSGLWTAIGASILPLIGLALLYTSKANAFFKN